MKTMRRNILTSLVCLTGLCSSLQAERYYSAWKQEYDTTFNHSQAPAAIAMDARGNVYVTGYAKNSSDVSRYYTAKYDALDGRKVWEAFEGTGSTIFEPKAIVVDSAGNVIVTGSRNAAGAIDFYTVKYNGTTGTQTWAVAYDGTASGQDIGLKVAVDSSNNVFVTGRSRGDNGNPTGDDIVTIKYNPTTGVQTGIDRYTTSGSRDDFPAALAVDSSNNVIVAGTANTGSGVFRLFVRKLNNTLTTAAWAGGGVTIDTGGDIGAAAMALDSSNNVAVTGQYRTNTSKHGFYTAMLASSDGSFIWETNTSSIPVSDDLIGAPTSITIGPDNNPVVTGFLKNASGDVIIRTIKYTGGGFFGGAIDVWDKSDTGLGFGDSSAHQVVSDGGSNAIIIGESDNADNDADIYMAKYDALTGDRLEFDTFAGTFGSDDTGVGAVVDGNGGVAVTGIAIGNVNNIGYQKFATIKYNRFIAYSGDALPDDTGVPVNALYAAGNSPAISDTSVAAKITAASQD